MSQVTDRSVGANPSGFDMRTELNNIIAAIESDNSGSSEPLNPVSYMKWLDTSNATYYYYKERNHDNTAWITLFRYTVATKIMEAVSNGVVLSQTNIANEIHNATSKTTLEDTDEIGIWDNLTSTLKKIIGSNLKATLKTYFDTLYIALIGDQIIGGVKTFSSSPLLPTPTVGDNSTKGATTAFVQTTLGSVQGALLTEYVVPSDTTSVNITSLDINTHKSYRVELDIYNPSASTTTLSLTVNGDNTLANYYYQQLQVSSTSVSGGLANSNIVLTIGNGKSSMANILLTRQTNGQMEAVSITNRNGGTTPIMELYSLSKIATVTNITQLSIIASVANSIGAGSKIRIYRGDK